MEALDILVPYQKAVLNDKSPLRLWEKSRRIGASFALALEAALDGMTEGGSNTWYISYNMDMTKQFIDDAKYWARTGRSPCSLPPIILKRKSWTKTTRRLRSTRWSWRRGTR